MTKAAVSSRFSSKSKSSEEYDYFESDGYWLDLIICFLLLFLGLYSRFYHLEHPNEVVFDEQHFGKFINWYLHGEYFLDIHPPLGKLLMMISGLILGYNDSIDYDETSAPYPDHSYMSLRFLPALFGGLLIPLMYIGMRLIPVSRGTACLVAWLVLMENIIITESRYILCDSFLFFFGILSIVLSIAANNQKILSIPWMVLLFLCGVALGLTVSVKFTGLGTLGTVVIHQCMILFINYDREYRVIFKDIAIRFSLLLLPCFVIFFAIFWIHLHILPYVGDGDLFMSHEFRANLLKTNGEPQEEYIGMLRLSRWDSMLEMLQTMHTVNIGLRASHPFQSYWYQWIFIQCKPVLYWQKLRAGYGMWIYCVGNTVNWLFSSIFGVFGFVILAVLGGSVRFYSALKAEADYSAQKQGSPAPIPDDKSLIFCFQVAVEKHWWFAFLMFVSFLGNFLPYCFIPRAVWNYHYVPALLSSFILTGIMIEIVLETTKRYDFVWHAITKSLCVFLIVCSTLCFLYFSPWTYGIPMGDLVHLDRFLFKSWEFTGTA